MEIAEEDEDYNSMRKESLAEVYMGYIAMSDREKIDTDPLGYKIASAVDNVRGNLDPGEWAERILKNAEKNKSLEEKAAEMLNVNIVKKDWNVYEHTGLVREILSECGIHRIDYNGRSKALSKANDTFVTNYSNYLLKRYGSN